MLCEVPGVDRRAGLRQGKLHASARCPSRRSRSETPRKPPKASELAAYCRQRLAGYKVPVSFQVVEQHRADRQRQDQAMKKRVETVAIIGGGPAGLTLASLLAMRGVDVTVFEDGKRPDLIVGESLVPAVVTTLRRLGIEERVAAIGLRKPGVSFTMPGRERVDFNFKNVERCSLPAYAYNVPRPAFDEILDARATELGARRVKTRAKLESDDGKRLRLADETLAQAPWLDGRQPDLLVDSTGRNRLFARLLEVPSETGPRRDVAHFAHFEGFEENEPRGQVVIGWLESGWNWRIPLPGRLSVGVVMNRDDAARLGSTAEERLENAIARDPVLAAAGPNRRRVSEVATYTNYQLVSSRGYGPGLGDDRGCLRFRGPDALARPVAGAAFGGTSQRTPRRSRGLLAADAPSAQGVDGDDFALLQRADFCDVPQRHRVQPEVSARVQPAHPTSLRHAGRVHGLRGKHEFALRPRRAKSIFQPCGLGKGSAEHGDSLACLKKSLRRSFDNSPGL